MLTILFNTYNLSEEGGLMRSLSKREALRMDISNFKEMLCSMEGLAIYCGHDIERANYRYILRKFNLIFDKYLDETYLEDDTPDTTK